MGNNVKAWLIAWFEQYTGLDKASIIKHEHENYFELKWIDSFGFISFITELEQHFNITFSNDEFQNKDFSTLVGLTTVIERRINEQH